MLRDGVACASFVRQTGAACSSSGPVRFPGRTAHAEPVGVASPLECAFRRAENRTLLVDRVHGAVESWPELPDAAATFSGRRTRACWLVASHIPQLFRRC